MATALLGSPDMTWERLFTALCCAVSQQTVKGGKASVVTGDGPVPTCEHVWGLTARAAPLKRSILKGRASPAAFSRASSSGNEKRMFSSAAYQLCSDVQTSTVKTRKIECFNNHSIFRSKNLGHVYFLSSLFCYAQKGHKLRILL